MELEGNTIRAFLDGQLIQTATRLSEKDAQKEFPHALIPDLMADPGVVEVDGTFYLFATTDGMGQGLATSGLPVVWKSKDFLHWSFEGSIFPDNFAAKYWAPSMPVAKTDVFTSSRPSITTLRQSSATALKGRIRRWTARTSRKLRLGENGD